MKLRLGFKTVYNLFLAGLLVLLVWSVWSSFAQTTNKPSEVDVVVTVKTNAVAAEPSAAPVIMVPERTVIERIADDLATRFPDLKRLWLGHELWKYIGSLIYIVLVFYVSKLLNYLTRVWLKNWAQKTENKFDDFLVELLNGPVKVVAFFCFLYAGLHIFQWPRSWDKYVASLIYVFLAFYISKFVDYLTRVWLKKWAEKTETKFDDLILDLLNGPVKVVVFVIFLHIGLNVFQWPEPVEMILSRGFTIVIAATLTYMVLKFVDLLLGYWKQRTAIAAEKAFNEQLFPIVRKSLKAFVIIIAVLVTSQNLGINVTAALASLSIGGLAIGLAAQDTLANLFGAVAVFMDKPFLVGERIQIDQVEGNVESIGMRSTRVRNAKGYLVTIPNKTVGNATITNITRRPTIQTEMNIGITYDTPAEKVRLALKLINEIYRSNPKTSDLTVSFNRFADSALNILVVHLWNGSDHKEYLAGMQEMNLMLKERFDKEKIGFAFPSQTLYLKQDSDWRLAQGNEGQKLLPESAGPKS